MIDNWRQLAKAKVGDGILISIWQTIEPGKKPFSVELIALNPHALTMDLPWSTPCDDLVTAAGNYVKMIDLLANRRCAEVTDWYVFDALANQQIISAIESREIQSLKNRIVREALQ